MSVFQTMPFIWTYYLSLIYLLVALDIFFVLFYNAGIFHSFVRHLYLTSQSAKKNVFMYSECCRIHFVWLLPLFIILISMFSSLLWIIGRLAIFFCEDGAISNCLQPSDCIIIITTNQNGTVLEEHTNHTNFFLFVSAWGLFLVFKPCLSDVIIMFLFIRVAFLIQNMDSPLSWLMH